MPEWLLILRAAFSAAVIIVVTLFLAVPVLLWFAHRYEDWLQFCSTHIH